MTHETDPNPAPRLMRGQTIGLIAVGLALAVVLVYVLAFGGTGQPIAKANAATNNHSIYADDRTMGNPKAPIVLIEYAAPSCSHCAHFFTSVFPKLKKQYIDTGKVYFAFRTFPLMPADGAIEAVARCQPPMRYFVLMHHIYANQKRWHPGYGVSDVRGALAKLFGEVGVNEDGFNRCMADGKIQDRLNRVAQDGELKYNIQAVPTFIVNGEVLENEHDVWPKMKAKFDSLLAKG